MIGTANIICAGKSNCPLLDMDFSAEVRIKELRQEIQNAKDPIEGLVLVLSSHYRDFEGVTRSMNERMDKIELMLTPIYEVFKDKKKVKTLITNNGKTIILASATLVAVITLWETLKDWIKFFLGLLR